MLSGKPKIWNVNVNMNRCEQIQLTKPFRNGWLAGFQPFLIFHPRNGMTTQMDCRMGYGLKAPEGFVWVVIWL